MLEGGYFIGGKSSAVDGGTHEDLYLDNGKIMFAPLDPIYVDDNNNVFYSRENQNAYMYSNADGNVFVKVVR